MVRPQGYYLNDFSRKTIDDTDTEHRRPPPLRRSSHIPHSLSCETSTPFNPEISITLLSSKLSRGNIFIPDKRHIRCSWQQNMRTLAAGATFAGLSSFAASASVDAGALTTVTAEAPLYDTNLSAANGCDPSGCVAGLTRVSTCITCTVDTPSSSSASICCVLVGHKVRHSSRESTSSE